MAKFALWIEEPKRRWRRLQDDTYNAARTDKGNWSSGIVGVGMFIGTMRSIAAPTLIAWRGRAVTKAEMQALSREEAIQIYKAKYWDDIRGDQINDQLMAEFIADMKSSAGGNAIKALQRALNRAGEKTPVDANFGTQTLALLNKQIAQNRDKIYTLFREEMVKHYQSIRTNNFSNWIKSLDKDYPEVPAEKTKKTKMWLFAFFVVLIVLIWYFFFKNSK
jgi:hypothetical protein